MFRKRSGVQKNLKKRPASEDDEAVPGKEEGGEGEAEVQSRDVGDAKKASSVDDFGAKRRRKNMTTAVKRDTAEAEEEERETITTTYESSRSLGLGGDQKATAAANVDTEVATDHRSVLERNEAIGKAILEGKLEEGVYRGMGAYRPAVNRREGSIAAGKYTGAFGPVRGSQNIRMTMRIDLNPEICKDYKETGYCGYGDSCIFLHDRSDYKPGWQLEKEWEAEQKAKQAKAARKLARQNDGQGSDSCDGSESDSSSEADSDEPHTRKLPRKCKICDSKWHDQSRLVATQCHHYFCEPCALTHYARSSKCAVCGQPTNGIFNSAARLLKARLSVSPTTPPQPKS